MRELVLTRHNELIDPLVRVWGWEIPVYLFLGGWVAGMMILVGYFLLRGRNREDTCVCSVLPGTSFVLLSPVSYTHLRAHETPEHLVCRLLLDPRDS